MINAVTTISRCLKKGIRFLESAKVPEAKRSAEALLAHVLRSPPLALHLDSEVELDPVCEERYEMLLGKRAGRYPLQYLTGAVSFRHALLQVGEGCFIPRPETEILAGVILNRLGPEGLSVLEAGTGSGNIAISQIGRASCRERV